MDYNIVCNGKSTTSITNAKNQKGSIKFKKFAFISCQFSFLVFSDATDNENDEKINLSTIPNLNWLIHISFTRQDYKYCKTVIDHQFRVSYDHEYLYIVKVSGWKGGAKSLFMILLI